MPRETAVSRNVLSDQIKERLLEAIMSGRYPPGARIIETRVAREVGTSQAPVREALRDLEAIGVVEIEAYRGARVRRPTADELLEAFSIRAELESLAARLAIPQLHEEDIADLQGDLDEISQAGDRNDTHAEAVADARFHERIVDLAGNRMLSRTWRYLEPSSRTYITLVVPGTDLRRIADLHQPILDALRRRDPELASEALHRHFVDAGSMLGRLWASLEPPVVEQQPGGARRAAGRRRTAGSLSTET